MDKLQSEAVDRLNEQSRVMINMISQSKLSPEDKGGAVAQITEFFQYKVDEVMADKGAAIRALEEETVTPL